MPGDAQAVLDDVRLLLTYAQETHRPETGLGKREIHPAAYRLQRKTDGDLFSEAEFNDAYRGVRSPEIRSVLDLFDEREECRVYVEEDGVDSADTYYRAVKEEDIEVGKAALQQLAPESRQLLNETLEQLDEDRLSFVQAENARISDHSVRSYVDPAEY